MLLGELAAYLEGLGIVAYDPEGVTGDTFISTIPATPNAAVALFPTGGIASDSKIGYKNPSVQIRVRSADRDPRPAFDRATAIYDALHGLAHYVLSNGTFVVGCKGLQSGPNYIGIDGSGRHEYTLNFLLDIRAPSRYSE